MICSKNRLTHAISCEPLFFWVPLRHRISWSKLGNGIVSESSRAVYVFSVVAWHRFLQIGYKIYCWRNLSEVSGFYRISLVPMTNSQNTKHFHRVDCSWRLSTKAFLFWLFFAQRSCCSMHSFWDSINCFMILLTFFWTLRRPITGWIKPPPIQFAPRSKSKIKAGLRQLKLSSKSWNSTKYFLKQLWVFVDVN